MNLLQQTYNFANEDTLNIVDLGYVIKNIGTPEIPFGTFINSIFTNFNLFSLLKVVEKQLNSTTSTEIQRVIEYDKLNGVLKIVYQNKFNNEDEALMFVRIFTNKKKIIAVRHEYCVIPTISRNKGLIKPIFQESLKQYVNLGLKKILVHAGLNNGGYTWAKHGFVAINKNEVESILTKTSLKLKLDEFAIVKKIFDIYYNKNPNGKSFPMDLWAGLDFMKIILNGSDWHGEIDLKNKEQFRNFRNYIFR